MCQVLYQAHYPVKLSEKERQTHRDRRDHYKRGRSNNGNKGDNVKSALFMHLGNEKSDSESNDQGNKQVWESDDSDSIDSDDDKDAYNVFSFCQIVGEDRPDEWESGSVDG